MRSSQEAAEEHLPVRRNRLPSASLLVSMRDAENMMSTLAANMLRNEGVVGVAARALRNLESVRAVRYEIYGAVEPLDSIDSDALRMIRLLNLVKDVDKLQTVQIGHQAFDVMDLGARLTASMSLIGAENRRNPEPKVLRSGDPEYTHLQTMEGQMREARIQLAQLVANVHVGLGGNARDGWVVDRNVLTEVNEKVRRVTYANLVLYDRLRHRFEDQQDNLMKLSDDVAVSVGLPRPAGIRVQEWLNGLEDDE